MKLSFKSFALGILLGSDLVTAEVHDVFLRATHDGEDQHHRGLAQCQTDGLPNLGLENGECGNTKCSSNDLEIVGADLVSDDCIVCNPDLCEQITVDLFLTIRQKTGSERTAFGYAATLEETLRDGCEQNGQTTVTCTDERCGGPVPPNTNKEDGFTDFQLPFGTITYTCGSELVLSNILQFWTDASDKSTCDSFTKCKDLSPKCGRPLGEIVIRPPLTVSLSATCDATGGTQTLTAVATGGFEPYSYSWEGGDAAGQTGATVANVASGVTYTVTVTDDSPQMCEASDSVNLDCCFFEATCIQQDPVGLTACDTSAVPPATDDISQIFSGVTTSPCGQLTLTSVDDESGTICPDGITVTRTYTLSDSDGNSEDCPRVYVVEADAVDPVIEDLPDGMESCAIGCPDGSCFDGPPTVNTVCDVGFTLSNVEGFTRDVDCSEGSDVGTYTNTWTAEDACGNVATETQTIVITNEQLPDITGLVDKEQECATGCAVVGANFDDCFDMPTATDECGDAVTPIGDDIMREVTSCGLTGTYAKVWTATDMCGNTNTATQRVIITDNTDPIIEGAVADEMKTCTEQIDAAPTLTASDTCGDVMLDLDCCVAPDEFGDVFINRVWTATDECGNEATVTQDIEIICSDPETATT